MLQHVHNIAAYTNSMRIIYFENTLLYCYTTAHSPTSTQYIVCALCAVVSTESSQMKNQQSTHTHTYIHNRLPDTHSSDEQKQNTHRSSTTAMTTMTTTLAAQTKSRRRSHTLRSIIINTIPDTTSHYATPAGDTAAAGSRVR